jgi:hypothetical protein
MYIGNRFGLNKKPKPKPNTEPYCGLWLKSARLMADTLGLGQMGLPPTVHGMAHVYMGF